MILNLPKLVSKLFNEELDEFADEEDNEADMGILDAAK